MSQTPKLQRWIDLVAALLARRTGATLVDLVDEIPGYQGKTKSALRRTFERDKDELRRLGVAIETVGQDGDAETRYRLAPAGFYLPYLALVTHRGAKRPTRIDRYGYQALQDCEFTDEEIVLLADAASRVQSLGDPVLSADARAAIAKIAVDVDPDQVTPTPGVTVLPTRPPAGDDSLTRLGDALRRRKQVTFTYYGIERDETERRTVLPYGLSFTAGHWYLHALDPARGAVRRFRVSRIEELAVNPLQPGTQDYEIPADFDLAPRAVPVPPWQLGEDAPVEVTVQLHHPNGHTRAARRLGTQVRGRDGVVRYEVRRREPFLRWLLGLAGDATPIAPPDIVREYRDLLERTRTAAAASA